MNGSLVLKARPFDRRSIPPSLRGVFGRCCYVRVRHFQSPTRKYNPSHISRLVDLGPMPRFKDMNRSIPGLGSHVLGDGDMKIGVGLSPNEYERDVGAPEIGQTGRVGSDFIRVLIGHLGE